MAKDTNNFSGKRPSSSLLNAKPYDANNSFVKKVATKVTDLIPQRSWISKWFNVSQDNGDMLNSTENSDDMELSEEIPKPPPLKRPRIKLDVTHPPGTFSIQPRSKASLNQVDSSKKQYSVCTDTSEDFLTPTTTGQSERNQIALRTNQRNATPRSELNSMISKMGQNNGGIINGMDDYSESSESTSGCSSLIPQTNRQEGSSNMACSSFGSRKRFIDDKLNFTDHLQLPRSLFVDSVSRDSLSSRRPNFNASIMTNPDYQGSPLSSPFYNGNITFGGANMAGLYKRSRILNSSNELQLKVPKRGNIQVKPSNATDSDSSGMSQTAKRILEALEHFSSPISDAKKIPLHHEKTPSTSSFMMRKRLREEVQSPSSRIGLRHLTRELSVPTVPDILKLKRRQKLQNTTLAARKIVSAGSLPPPDPQDYRLGSEIKENSKYHGKIKTKSKVKVDEEETVEQVNLPDIPLPISSLPVFNFTFSEFQKSSEQKSTDPVNDFKFSSPIKLTNTQQIVQPVNNFKFRNPLSVENQAFNENSSIRSDASTISLSTSSTLPNFNWTESSSSLKLKEKKSPTKEPSINPISTELKTGSVMDFFNSLNKKTMEKSINEKGINPNNTDNWECTECLIRNSNLDAHCSACKASKCSDNERNNNNNKNNDYNKTSQSPVTLNPSAIESKQITKDCFGSQFKLSNNHWICNSCCTKNRQIDLRCNSCDAMRTKVNKSELESTTSIVEPMNSDPMEKFKPPQDSWECPGCMLRNVANVILCPCCGASKPNNLKTNPKESFKTNTNISPVEAKKDTGEMIVPTFNSTLPTGKISPEKLKSNKTQWECPSCMVRNEDAVKTCPCCQTPKPGESVVQSKKIQLSPSKGLMEKFKKPEGFWTCDTCLIQNEGKITECVACSTVKPGTDKPKLNEIKTIGEKTFSFGIPDKSTNKGSFSFGIQDQNTPSQFKFGIDKTSSTSITGNNITPSGFTFGVNTTKMNQVPTTVGKPKDNEKPMISKTVEIDTKKTIESKTDVSYQFGISNSESKKDTPTFSFGTGQTQASTATSTSITPSFIFGAPKTDLSPKTKNEEIGTTASTLKSNKTIDTKSTPVVQTFTSPSNTLETKTMPQFLFGSTTPKTYSMKTDYCRSICTTSLPTQSPPSFTFTNAQLTMSPATAESSAFASISTSTTAPSFSFGKESSVETTAKTEVKSFDNTMPTSMFSGVTNIHTNSVFQNNETPKNMLSKFGTNENKTPTAFIMSENKVPAFQTAETKKPSIFGTPKTSPAPAIFGVPSNLFGSNPAPGFGNNPLAFNTGTTTQSIFPSTKPNETNVPNSSLFTFGTPNVASNPTPGVSQPTSGFNFTPINNNPSTTTPKPMFPFGGIANTPPTANVFGGGAFNAPPTNSFNFAFNPPKPEQSVFGTPVATATVFGTPQQITQGNQATSTFPSAPTVNNTGFNFNNPAQSTSGGFEFGPMATASSVPSSGFNFNAPNPTSNFDPNKRPSFNFTGGKVLTTFNAPPQQTPQRQIKKAVRRIRDPQQR